MTGRTLLRSFAVAASLALSACATMPPPVPINRPSAAPEAGGILPPGMALEGDAIALVFSGGGARAAAFSYGVLRGLGAMPARAGGSLLDRVALLSGVSGGSISAAWFGLHGAAGLDGFRAAYLDRDWQSELHTSAYSPRNWLALSQGGMNSAGGLTAWLDAQVFRGARMADLRRRGRPAVLISATDMANRTPFVFAAEAFSALCSDLDSVLVADAVGASMAVPLLFRPVVVQAFPAACTTPMPDWTARNATRRAAPRILRSLARAYRSYRDPRQMAYVHLFDGGVTDNFGLSGMTAARLSEDSPYGPLEPRDVVRLRSITFVLVDSGQSHADDWALKLAGPNGEEVGKASIGAAMDSSARAYYDAFHLAMRAWEREMRDYRCALPAAEVKRLRGTLAGWDCAAIALTVDFITFADLPPAQRDELAAVDTQVSLKPSEVDRLIAGGETAARVNQTLKALTGDPEPAQKVSALD